MRSRSKGLLPWIPQERQERPRRKILRGLFAVSHSFDLWLSALVDHAILHDKGAVCHHLDILQGAAVKGDDIGQLARFDGTDLVVPAHHLSVDLGCCQQCLCGSEIAEATHELKLKGLLAVVVEGGGGVGAKADLHTHLAHLFEILPVVFQATVGLFHSPVRR